MKKYCTRPIFFNENRNYRIYLGGKELAKFHGKQEEDNYYPEEWLASTVKAINNDSINQNEGLSIIKNTDIIFSNLLEKYPNEILNNQEWDILVKFLDSAIRLPIQVHPTKENSKKYFNNNHGKTEMWIVLSTRENASISLGFKDKITKEEFKELIRKSKEDKEILEGVVQTIKVKKGDAFFVPAGLVHAIGAGCFILEIQEATDYTIQPEFWIGDLALNDYQRYLGLSEDDALDIFDYEQFGNGVIQKYQLKPRIIEDNEDYKKTEIITYQTTSFFEVFHYEIKKSMQINKCPALFVVTAGVGYITDGINNFRLKQGDHFFMPYLSQDKYKIYGSNLEVYECFSSQN